MNKCSENQSQDQSIYLSINERVQVQTDYVRIKDVASLYLEDKTLKNQIENQLVYCYQPVGQKDKRTRKRESRQVISALRILQVIQRQVSPKYKIIPVSCSDCIVERIYLDKWTDKRVWNLLKVAVICFLSMIGGAFSIMAFHNDVGLNHIFAQVYELIAGIPSDGFTILEVSYSLGLMLGIVIFYDHIGKRRICSDPSPIEVSMRGYEQQMNQAMTTTWEREKKTIDVQ